MPLFVSPEDVILRMQLDNSLTGITDVVKSGIEGAQLHVERAIDGKLARQHQKALYYVDAESFSGIVPNGMYRLEIPSGLVRQDAPRVVTSTLNVSGGPFATYTAVDPELMLFDYDRGYLFLDKTYANTHVRVECDTGYEPGTNPLSTEDLAEYDNGTQYSTGDIVAYGSPELVAYVATSNPPIGTVPTNPTYWTLAYIEQEPIPDAIYEAIMSLVPMVFNAQQTTNRSDEAQKQYKTLTDHANLLLAPYARTKGLTFRAI